MGTQKRVRTGVSSILKGVRLICRVAEKFNTVAYVNTVNPQLAVAIQAVVTACAGLRALDDFPGEIDNSGLGAVGEDLNEWSEGDSSGSW